MEFIVFGKNKKLGFLKSLTYIYKERKNMLNFKPYFYYYKNDSKKEPIDKILAPNENEALIYFSERKQIDEYTFTTLYNIETYEETKSE